MATTRTTSNQPLEVMTTAAIDTAVDIANRAAEFVAGNIPDRSEDVAPVLDAVVAGQTVAAQAVEFDQSRDAGRHREGAAGGGGVRVHPHPL